jgi:DNA-binding winged helix-turn-helix (wHTH) protein
MAGVVSEKKVRFDAFVLDFGRFELVRGGQPVKLEGLPLQLLMFLVEKQGQLVTRQQISSALWGDGVFVDVEQGINTAIRKVRMALDDDSERPQYLQTVVGRGYRFIAPIRTDEGALSTASVTGEPSVVSFEELGRAIMTAAGLDPDIPRTVPKPPDES